MRIVPGSIWARFGLGWCSIRARDGADPRPIQGNLSANWAVWELLLPPPRGMDYPNVNLVVQFGAPATRELYIHRVGRTARAGRAGRAVLLLGELERNFLKAVEDLPLVPSPDTDALRRVNELIVKARGRSTS